MIKNTLFYVLFIAIILFCLEGKIMSKTLYIEELMHNQLNGANTTYKKETYYSKNKILIIDSSQPYKILINLKDDKVFFIDDKFNRYSYTTLKKFNEITKNTNIYNQLTDDDIIIEQTNKKKKINNYNCFEVIIFIPKIGMKTVAWLSKIKQPLDNYYNFNDKSVIGGQIKKLINLQKKNKAYTILSESVPVSTVGGRGKFIVEVKKITTDKFSDELFSVPEKYNKVPLFK